MRLALLLSAAVFGATAIGLSPAPSAQSSATYRVTFESTWSAQTHPVDYPGASAHYSQLVGATHATAGVIWSAGATASPGVEQMAETGGTSMLRGESDGLMASGEVLETLLGPFMGTSPSAVSMEITLDEAHPRVSLVTMIAPSPDWFVGVDGLRLFDAGGWLTERDVDLTVWDAGTDSGTTYASPDANTNPQQPIELSSAAPFAAGVPVGRFRFERLSVVAGEADAPAAFAVGTVAPQPTRGRASLALTLAESDDVSVRILDVLGREVARRDLRLAAGAHRVELPSDGLAAGSYVVRVTASDAATTRRLTVAR